MESGCSREEDKIRARYEREREKGKNLSIWLSIPLGRRNRYACTSPREFQSGDHVSLKLSNTHTQINPLILSLSLHPSISRIRSSQFSTWFSAWVLLHIFIWIYLWYTAMLCLNAARHRILDNNSCVDPKTTFKIWLLWILSSGAQNAQHKQLLCSW